MLCRLGAHHALSVPTARAVDDWQVFCHVATDEFFEEDLFLEGPFDFFLYFLGMESEGGESLDFGFRIGANLFIDVKAKGKVVIE